jgi:hypothetical protein
MIFEWARLAIELLAIFAAGALAAWAVTSR